MALSPIGASGLQAFQNANQRLNDAASRIASATAQSGELQNATQSASQDAQQVAESGQVAPANLNDITSAIVDLNVAEQQAGAAAKVIETENQVIGTLLDTFA